ncbi:MAG TPA: cation:dicarboxylase symporter family transporter [Burkholderiaceae bacterium]|nr:cation:dicarboxylase symporter family transporter [Burkholderiaceae bacterium]
MNKFQSLSINPWVIGTSLAAGALLGLTAPATSQYLGFIGEAYVDMLKMIVLPFMVSAVIFSLQRLLRHGGSASIFRRAFAVFTLALLVVAALGVLVAMPIQSRGSSSASQVAADARIAGQEAWVQDTLVELDVGGREGKAYIAEVLRGSLVPANVFAALVQGETLKALAFALLFGMAAGKAGRGADGLARGLEAAYNACQKLTQWLKYPLPLVLLCISAGQLAKTGIAPLVSMVGFLVVFAAASFLVVTLSVLCLWRRSGLALAQTLQCLRTPIALALATRSGAACMPSMIESLSGGMRCPRERVELLVPLSISLLRAGPVLYYVCATMFIAHIYGRVLVPSELMVVAVASVLAGFASAGTAGLATVSLTGMACGWLGLPFEAAFVLFIAIDPLCDMLRTLVLVLGNSAAVSLICPRPEAPAVLSWDTPTQPFHAEPLLFPMMQHKERAAAPRQSRAETTLERLERAA